MTFDGLLGGVWTSWLAILIATSSRVSSYFIDDFQVFINLMVCMIILLEISRESNQLFINFSILLRDNEFVSEFKQMMLAVRSNNIINDAYNGKNFFI